jgi:hypothetical protein
MRRFLLNCLLNPREVFMFRKALITLVATAAIALAPTGASARFGGGGFHGGGFHGGFAGGGWRGGGWGPGLLAGALIGGAIASSAYGYYDGPYYGGYYPGYSYYPAYVDYGWEAIQEPGAARFHRPYGYGWRPWGY